MMHTNKTEAFPPLSCKDREGGWYGFKSKLWRGSLHDAQATTSKSTIFSDDVLYTRSFSMQ